MSTRRRPLGQGPVPLREYQEQEAEQETETETEQRVARGRTAAERATEDPAPTAPPETQLPTARRALGFGHDTRTTR
ncbi:hypothetical protein Snoj_35170 [Streptomyces nojiriensis]|uniref:Uncharacterized protein n=1 Tax=Streptomyces nojiriensis TaxID=66374 RepID=A0ABQ3SN81_9ACTN|nr:hypothetical protein [Streptomyces nojiriensis]QTI43156.1 hypothetical protein JYK04_00918 [Streptomyces nojiriensis]GGS31558.1 hypothetical protein GCM10010205_72250 [Streptomyces nojiriensis]GHI69599.1 hypothetical protein Snoj_35170 [Streptomyces nojiriensis]